MQSFKRAPFFLIVTAFIAGILIQYHLQLEWKLLLIALTGSILIILLSSLLSLTYRYLFGLYLNWNYLILIVLLGSIVCQYRTSQINSMHSEPAIYLGVIENIPEETAKSNGATVQVKFIVKNGSPEPVRTKVLAYFQKDSRSLKLKPGDVILFQSRMQQTKNYGNPGEFNYKRYLAVQNIHHQVYIPGENWKILEGASVFSLPALANTIRLNLIQRLQQTNLGNDEFAVASALILGYKDQLNNEIKERFSSTGATHILAVSGLHVGIIFFFFHFLLLFMERNPKTRILKTFFIILILLGYAFLTGLSPSVSRASLMFSIIAIGKTTQRYSSVYNSLAFSAFILLFINPLLIFSVGFQLSYLAVLSIVFFQPRLYKLVSLPLPIDKLWQWLTVAMAAQIGTAPLVIYYFHQFPNYFWMSNFVAIPAATGILITGILFFATSLVSLPFSKVIAWILDQIISLLHYLLDQIDHLPFSLTTGLSLEPVQLMFIYGLILVFALFVVKHTARRVMLCLGFLILLLSWNIYNSYQKQGTTEFVVYNVPKQSVYNFLGETHNYVFMNEPDSGIEKIQFFTQNNWVKKSRENPILVSWKNISPAKNLANSSSFYQRNSFISIHGTRIFRAESNYPQNPVRQKIELDYIIISDACHWTFEQIQSCFSFSEIILDSSMPYYTKQRWKKKLTRGSIPYHDVTEEGAFRIEFSQKNSKKI